MTQPTVTPAEAQRLLASGQAMLIDVREPDEFRAAHIAYAASMPLGQLAALLAEARLPADRTLIFQCQKGGRGGQACALAAPGFAGEIRNLEGGIEGWRAAGLPVTGTAPGGVSIFRQVQMIVGLLVAGFTLAGLSGFGPGFYVAGLFGAMLAFAGFSGWCGLGLLLQRMPWNRAAG
ncbi:rhodanese-like domain-containing protein [Sphingomonas sp. CJ20]